MGVDDPRAPRDATRSVEVWDFPTRAFHWVLALLVIANFFTAEDEGALLAVHVYFGYLIGLLVIFRIVWGLIGNRHARFRDFVKPWPETRDYIRQLLRLAPPRYVGHNPLGGWSVLLMMGLLGLIVFTGMATAVGEGARIPFLNALPHWLCEASEEVHETAANLMMVVAGIHVIGVLADWMLTRENLVKVMFTGRKTLPEPVTPAPSIGAWRGAVLGTLLVAGAGWMVDQTSLENLDDEQEEHEERYDEDEHEKYRERRHEDDEHDRRERYRHED